MVGKEVKRNLQPYREYNCSQRNKKRKNIDNKNAPLSCFLCKEQHRLMKCEVFLEKSPEQRKHFVINNKLCLNCLSNNHFVKECQSKYRCTISNCGKSHHTTLHDNYSPANDTAPLSVNRQNINSHTFLQVIPVTLTNGNYQIQTNALLDSGSDATLIHEDVAAKIHLEGKH